MSDLKMGLKNVILQRIQNSENIEKNTINLNQRKLTDFSIKRILGEEILSTSENENKLNIKNIGENIDILDLSKNGKILPSNLNFNENSFYDYYYGQMDYQKQLNFNQELLMSSDYLIKPKVYKLTNQYFNKNLINFNNNSNFKSDNYIGCELYFNNNNNFYHHNYYQYSYQHPQYHQSSVMSKNISSSSINGLAINQPWVHSILPTNSKEKLYTKSSGSLAFSTITNTTIGTTLQAQNQINNLPTKQKEVSNLRISTNLMIVNDPEISFKCHICDKVFGCSNILQSHIKSHKSPRYGCIECGKGFSQLRNYKYHLSVHRGTKEFAAKCPVCGKIFNDKGYLSSHMKIHRNKKEYECPYCPKSFNQRVAFNMHVRIHTGVKPHKCVECGKRFSRKMLLKQHMRTHSGEKPYQCSVCGKSFADRSNMTLHHRLHSGIKPFTCPICPKAFTKKHHLKTHLNYHTGCKPYVCPHLNCNQAFTQSSNMRTHAKKCQYKPFDVVQTQTTETNRNS